MNHGRTGNKTDVTLESMTPTSGVAFKARFKVIGANTTASNMVVPWGSTVEVTYEPNTKVWYASTVAATNTPVVLPTRKKNEVRWDVVTGHDITTTVTNLITYLKTLGTPTAGTLDGFFNTTSNKLNVYNDNATVLFKIGITGTWTASSDRSMEINFVGTTNRLLANRSSAIAGSDTITLGLFLSIDKDGTIASNGSVMNINSNGGNFVVTAIQVIAEQVTAETAIIPH